MHGLAENTKAARDATAAGVRHEAIVAEAAAQGRFLSRRYTDRSNCRKAMKAHAAKAKLSLDKCEVVDLGDKHFAFDCPGAPAAKVPAVEGDGLDIPAILKRPAQSAEDRRALMAKHAGGREEHPGKRLIMPKPEQVKAAKATERDAKAAAKAQKPGKARKAGKARYPWSEVEEAAKGGKLPPSIDFSADTHKRFRPALAEIIAAIKTRDVKAVRAVKVPKGDSSMRTLLRFRDASIVAIQAQAKAKAAA